MAARPTYRHFCLAARALEVVGERWSLLIVRDLLFGPRRFTDLLRGLNEITPTRLTERLRQLEAAELIVRQPPSQGREVWYRLTESGRELEPVLEALTLWGIENRVEPPRPGQPVRSEPVMLGTKVWLSRNASDLARVSWVWQFAPDDLYTVRLEDGSWVVARGSSEPAAVTVTSTPETWAQFLTTKRDERQLPGDGIALAGSRRSITDFAKAFGASLRSN